MSVTTGRPTRAQQAAEMAKTMPIEQVAAALGIKVQSARNYVNTTKSFTGRVREGNPARPRCICGLSLPCTCEGKRRSAVDFMGRRDEPVIAATGW